MVIHHVIITSSISHTISMSYIGRRLSVCVIHAFSMIHMMHKIRQLQKSVDS